MSTAFRPLAPIPRRTKPAAPPSGEPPAPSLSRPAAGRAGKPSEKKSSGKPDRRMVQLVICLVIFGLALAVKTFFPEQALEVRAALSQSIGGGVDYKAALASMGRALSGEGELSEVWEALSGAPKSEVGAPVSPSPSPSPSSSPTPSPSPTPEGQARFVAPPEESETGDLPAASGADATALSYDGEMEAFIAAWAATPLSGWEFSLSEEDAEDDTAPIPFGFVLPPTVDYALYDLPFSYVVPVSGTFTSDFGYRDHPILGETKFHYGVDIAAATGTGIRCFADGKVETAGFSNTYGYYVKVMHKDGFISFYAHCSKLLVKAGQTVKKGDSIARVGATGLATGPHLHFEVRRDDTILNPMQYVGASLA